ncbi:MAG: pentapeptide repeat-containing protein [Acidobacteriota bacterium]
MSRSGSIREEERQKVKLVEKLRSDGGIGAALEKTNLRAADLQGVAFDQADLRGADLRWSNLRRAGLRGARMQDANLHGARLEGADMLGANIAGASLDCARLDPTTRLPDGTFWTPDRDLSKYGVKAR